MAARAPPDRRPSTAYRSADVIVMNSVGWPARNGQQVAKRQVASRSSQLCRIIGNGTPAVTRDPPASRSTWSHDPHTRQLPNCCDDFLVARLCSRGAADIESAGQVLEGTAPPSKFIGRAALGHQRPPHRRPSAARAMQGWARRPPLNSSGARWGESETLQATPPSSRPRAAARGRADGRI